MIFVYKKWDDFCKILKNNDIVSIPAKDVFDDYDSFLVLKHDVENNVPKAFEIAKIESKYGHKGSYYVQAYLLDNEKNILLLKEMQKMGHEISYHYDVMDSCHGDLELAKEEFEKNKAVFEKNGFILKTVCQHGNPVVERIGYTSNRDFFRNEGIKNAYPNISDIMVNFPENHNVSYTYYSDAGRKFKMIFDPFNNDIINSDEKNITYNNLNDLFCNLDKKAIISIHPHRWEKSKFKYIFHLAVFKVVKFFAKIIMRIPMFRKFMSKYYYLAKKI
ncbi:MAG: hypothetical protein MJ080_02990 [Clostridia bacterium]|nr:hypothetical protein [Clostridia bacterium]